MDSRGNISNTKNWGRWGVTDERGALNHITPKSIRRACSLVKKGIIYSLAVPWDKTPIQENRVKPMHFMTIDGGDYAAGSRRIGGTQICDDTVILSTHNVTHIDALCHVWYDDKLYNGFSGNTVRSRGAKYCGIDKMKWLFTRGLLIDIAKYKKVDHLKKGELISKFDLEECLKCSGLSIEPGDAILIRTGWLRTLSKNEKEFTNGWPGIDLKAAVWLGSKMVCAVGADNLGLEVYPIEDETTWLPVHKELVRNQGIYIMEQLNLEDLSRDGVLEFALVVAPLSIPGGTASPVNPLALI
jgi:kynurenine formamidase